MLNLIHSRIPCSLGLLGEVLWVKLVRVAVVLGVHVQPCHVDPHHVVLLQGDVGPGNGVGYLAVAEDCPKDGSISQSLMDNLVQVGKVLGNKCSKNKLMYVANFSWFTLYPSLSGRMCDNFSDMLPAECYFLKIKYCLVAKNILRVAYLYYIFIIHD